MYYGREFPPGGVMPVFESKAGDASDPTPISPGGV
jgi:hypothetical protein